VHIEIFKTKREFMKNKYVNVITENEEIAFNVFLGRLGMQAAIMESQGYNKAARRRYLTNACVSLGNKDLNEGFLDSLGSAAKWLSNNGMFQGFQKMIATAIADPLAGLLGIPKDGFMYKIFVNVIENMDFATVTAVISGKGCKPLAVKIAGAVQESVVETVLQQMDIGQSGFGAAVREGIQAAFAEGGPFVNSVANAICDFDFESILPGMGKPEDIAAKAAAAQGTAIPPKAVAALQKQTKPKVTQAI